MLKQFEELPENVQALMLAKLAIEMKAAKAHSIYHLAKMKKSALSDLWRNICRKAAQPLCTIPMEALEKPDQNESGELCPVGATSQLNAISKLFSGT